MGKDKTYEALQSAAGYGDAAELEKLLQSGADPNLTGAYGSILSSATWHHNLEAVRVLLKYGAKPNLYKGDALLKAVSTPNQGDEAPDVLRALAAKGADINRVFHVQSEIPEATPLMTTIFFGYAKMAETLIELGADVTFSSKAGQSAFSLAAENNLQKIGQMLIERGFKPNPQNKQHAAFLKKLKQPAAKTNNYLEKIYYLVPTKSATAHTSGAPGLKKIMGADTLPLCPNPAVNLLTLDLRQFKDLPANIRKVGVINVPFYCCSDCNGEPDELEFKIGKGGKIKLLSKVDGKPQRCSTEAAGGLAKKSFLKVQSKEPSNRWGIFIGGSPRWCQSPHWGICPECGENGFFIGQIHQSLVPPGNGGPDNLIYMFVCGDCRTEMIVRQMT